MILICEVQSVKDHAEAESFVHGTIHKNNRFSQVKVNILLIFLAEIQAVGQTFR